MDETLIDFVRVLRNAEVRVSPAEALDALHAVRAVGIGDRDILQDALSACLAKTVPEKEIYDHCFSQFFSQRGLDAKILEDNGADEEAPSDRELLEASAFPTPSPGVKSLSDLARMVLDANDNALNAAISSAANSSGLAEIRYFTQKGLYARRILEAMGLREFDEDIHTLEQVSPEYRPGRAEARRLKQARQQLWDRVSEHVEQNYLLFARQHEHQLRDSVLRGTRLSNLERRDLHRLRLIVQRIARRLASRYSRRRRVSRRGHLDVPRTLRAGTATDGVLFERHWKTKRKDRPSILVLCDVSGSVRSYARFLLLFLYSLNEVLPSIRSFVFCDRTVEVSQLFSDQDAPDAIETALTRYATGSSDYGRSLLEFAALSGRKLDQGATLIVLGDARNNYGDPALGTFRDIARRARRVLWLNPESLSSWQTGDSEMLRYSVYCNDARVCQNLQDLERFASDLLRATY